MPQAYFDNYALEYDQHFSDSPVGRAQRKVVHSYLDGLDTNGCGILEINCGTGEDAVFLAGKCKEITCTDISNQMVDITLLKTNTFNNCSVIRSSVQELETKIKKKTDFIFSNFGGLNCLKREELIAFSESCRRITHEKSDLIFVIMGKKCIWEKIYFTLKGNFKMARRRKQSEGAVVGTNNTGFKVYYYSPDEVSEIFGFDYELIYKAPVGLFVPPSYLNPFFGKHRILFSLLCRLDKLFSSFSFLSDYADHYLIHLKRK